VVETHPERIPRTESVANQKEVFFSRSDQQYPNRQRLCLRIVVIVHDPLKF
jgi:hypothetical protein